MICPGLKLMLRLIVLGPSDYEDYEFVKEQLNRLTMQADDVTLICGEEASFPPALKWMHDRWLKAVRKKKHRFAVLRNHFLKHELGYRDKYKRQWREMVQDANAVIVFWEAGNVDSRVEGLVQMAKVYDLPVKKVLV